MFNPDREFTEEEIKGGWPAPVPPWLAGHHFSEIYERAALADTSDRALRGYVARVIEYLRTGREKVWYAPKGTPQPDGFTPVTAVAGGFACHMAQLALAELAARATDGTSAT